MDRTVPRRVMLAVLATTGLSACGGSVAPNDAQGDDTNSNDAGRDDSSAADDATDGAMTCAAGPDELGTVDTFGVGTWRIVRSNGTTYIVARDADGVFAYSGRCTHQGCEVRVARTTGVATCPCHGAMFDANGAVTLGPARRALSHFQVTLCDGVLSVDNSVVVPATTRLPV